MTRVTLLLLSLVLAGLSAAAQTASETIRTRTEIVLVPVIVNDANGNHITGLTKADFIVKENGKERPVASLEEVVSGSGSAEVVTNGFTNFGVTSSGARKLTIIAIDLVNSKFEDQTQAKKQIMRFLEGGIRPGELVALLAIEHNQIRVLHDFSKTSDSLLKTLREFNAQNNATADVQTRRLSPATPESAELARQLAESMNPSSDMNFGDTNRLAIFLQDALSLNLQDDRAETQIQRQAIEITLEALAQIGRSYGDIPGRKSLLWITGGLPFNLENPAEFIDLGMRRKAEESLQALNDANISVYPIDARGLTTLAPTVQTRPPVKTYTEREFGDLASRVNYSTTASMRLIAERTGGVAFFNTNDLARSFERANADGTRYYMLSYYLDKENTKEGWRRLNVKLARKGVDVRARTGFYYLDQRNNAPDKNAELQAAVSSPLDSPAVPFGVQWTGTAASDGARRVEFAVTLPGRGITLMPEKNHLSLDFVAVARNVAGEPAQTFAQTYESDVPAPAVQQIARDGVVFRNALLLPPGRYEVRFVVRDNLAGRTGSLTAPLTVN